MKAGFPVGLLTSFVLAASLAWPGMVEAQSAADKATARELAVAGINEFKQGSYESALDKLERAQQLYDAHVHLVYMARCQAALGKLVEAAESYRELARKPLPKDASDAVRQAQEDGAEELTALEPRIPKLRIDVVPPKVAGLQLSINGVEVPAAAVGVDRSANPGENVIRVGAPGYKTAEAKITLAEGGRDAVTVTLEQGEGGPPVVEGQPAPGAVPPAGGTAGEAPAEGATPPPAPKPVSFVIEPRLSVLAPFGEIGAAKATKVVRGGGGAELRFGVHFMKRFTALAMLHAHGLAPLSGFESFAFDAFDNPDTSEDEARYIESGSTSTVGLGSGGVGFMYSTPHHQLGYFVELDLLAEYMAGSTEIFVRGDAPPGFVDCTTETMFAGGGIRLSGGGVIPLANLVQLTPYLGASLASFPEAQLRGDCEKETAVPLDTVHGWVGLGVGAQFMLGE